MNRTFQQAISVLRIGCVVLMAVVYADPVGAAAPPSEPPDADEQRDRDLSKRLIREATTGADVDIMSEVASLMSDARHRLVRDLDAGPRTQAVQQRVVRRLDDAIQMALQQRSRVRSPQTSEGERRELPERPGEEQAGKRDEHGPGATDPGTSVDTGPNRESDGARRGSFRESRRGWGHLPARDRDELLQGIEEAFIERYRPQIEQYYRALTETEESQ